MNFTRLRGCLFNNYQNGKLILNQKHTLIIFYANHNILVISQQNAGLIVNEKVQKKVQKLVTKKEKKGKFRETLSYKENSVPRVGKKASRFAKKQLISGNKNGVPWQMSIVADEEPDFWERKFEDRLRKVTRHREVKETGHKKDKEVVHGKGKWW